jgi:hypothetical protein
VEPQLPTSWRDTVDTLRSEVGDEHAGALLQVARRLADDEAEVEAEVASAARRARQQARRTATVASILPVAVALVLAVSQPGAVRDLLGRPSVPLLAILALTALGVLWLRVITRPPFAALPWRRPAYERRLEDGRELLDALHRASLHAALGASPPKALDRAAPPDPDDAARQVADALRRGGPEGPEDAKLPAPGWLVEALRGGPRAPWSVDTIDRAAGRLARERRRTARRWPVQLRLAATLPIVCCLLPASVLLVRAMPDRPRALQVALVVVSVLVLAAAFVPWPSATRVARSRAVAHTVWSAASRPLSSLPGFSASARDEVDVAAPPATSETPTRARTRMLVAEGANAARLEGRIALFSLAWLPLGVLVVNEFLRPGATLRMITSPRVLVLLLAAALAVIGTRWLAAIAQPPFTAFPDRSPRYEREPARLGQLADVLDQADALVRSGDGQGSGVGIVPALARVAPPDPDHPVHELLAILTGPRDVWVDQGEVPVWVVDALRRNGPPDAILTATVAELDRRRRLTAQRWSGDVRRAAVVPFLVCILPASLLLLVAAT